MPASQKKASREWSPARKVKDPRIQTLNPFLATAPNLLRFLLCACAYILSIQTIASCSICSDAYSTNFLKSSSSSTFLARDRISKQTSLNTKSEQPVFASSTSSSHACSKTLFNSRPPQLVEENVL